MSTYRPNTKRAPPRMGPAVGHPADELDDGGRRVLLQSPAGDTICPSLSASAIASSGASFEAHLAGDELVKSEGGVEVLGLEAGSLDGLLRAHAEIQDVQQDLKQGLILVVAAGSGHGE